MGVFRPKNWAPPSTCERVGQPTVCREKKWNSLTDVLVVLSALIINRWERGPIYQSGEKLIDTGFDFIAVTCCLGTSQFFFLVRFQGSIWQQEHIGKSTQTNKQKKLFHALSLNAWTNRHMHADTHAQTYANLCSRMLPCHFPTVAATHP